MERTKGGLPEPVKSEDRQRLWQRFYEHCTKRQDGYLIRATNVIEQLGERFTFDAFAEILAEYGREKEKPAQQTDLIQALLNMRATMRKTDRIGNGQLFEFAATSLRRFVASFTGAERKEFLNIPLPRRSSQPRRNTHVAGETLIIHRVEYLPRPMCRGFFWCWSEP